MGDTAISAASAAAWNQRKAIFGMADFDETAIRSPREAGETIRAGSVEPWMVWSAAGVLVVLAMLGLLMGLRGRQASGVTLSLTPGAAISPATVATATPAAPLSKDPQWSILSGTEIKPKPVVVAKSAASDDSDSGDEASAEPAAEAAAPLDEAIEPAPPPPVQAQPAPSGDAQPPADTAPPT